MLLLQTRNLFALKEGSPITKVTGMEQNTRDARGRNRRGSAQRSPIQRKQDVIKWGSRLIPSAVASGRSEAAGEDVDAEAARGRAWKAFAGVRATRNEWNCSFIFFSNWPDRSFTTAHLNDMINLACQGTYKEDFMSSKAEHYFRNNILREHCLPHSIYGATSCASS